jgi:hypothetical protein
VPRDILPDADSDDYDGDLPVAERLPGMKTRRPYSGVGMKTLHINDDTNKIEGAPMGKSQCRVNGCGGIFLSKYLHADCWAMSCLAATEPLAMEGSGC